MGHSHPYSLSLFQKPIKDFRLSCHQFVNLPKTSLIELTFTDNGFFYSCIHSSFLLDQKALSPWWVEEVTVQINLESHVHGIHSLPGHGKCPIQYLYICYMNLLRVTESCSADKTLHGNFSHPGLHSKFTQNWFLNTQVRVALQWNIHCL